MRFKSIFVIVLTIFLFYGINVNATAIIAKGDCGTSENNLTWNLDNDGVLTISGEGYMTDWTSASTTPWAVHAEDINKIIVDEGVMNIGEFAFSDCVNLESVSIADSVTSIGLGAFEGCSSLAYVYYKCLADWYVIGIDEKNDSLMNAELICRYEYSIANGYCGSTSYEYDVAWVLYDNGDLFIEGKGDMTDYIQWDMYEGQGIKSMIKTTEIEEGVTSIGDYAFSDCINLESVSIADSVTSIGLCAFEGCSSLQNITIPKSVTYIGDAIFENCSNLRNINVDENNPNYSSYDGVLFNKDMTCLLKYPCWRYGEYLMPDSVTSIGSNAFSDSGLSSISIPDRVTNIGVGAFEDCLYLNSVDFPDTIKSINFNMFRNCVSLESIVIPDKVTSIEDVAFYNCARLKSIIIPECVESIGIMAFSNCSSLKSVAIPKSCIYFEREAFAWCPKLETVYYAGTKEAWDILSDAICNDMSDLNKATILYNYMVTEDGTIHNELLKTFEGEDGSTSSAVLSTITLGNKSVKSITWQYYKAKAKFDTVLTGAGSSYVFGLIVPNTVYFLGEMKTTIEYFE